MNKKNKQKHVSIPKGTKLPRPDKKKEFLFITSLSVFAALVIFVSEFMVQAKREARQAAQENALMLAPLDITKDVHPSPSPGWLKYKPAPTPRGEIHRANPSVKPSPRATIRPRTTPHPKSSPIPIHVAE